MKHLRCLEFKWMMILWWKNSPVIQAIHLYRYTFMDPCSILLPNTFCVIYRFIQQLALVLPTFLHVTLTINRLLACQSFQQNKNDKISTTIVLCLFSESHILTNKISLRYWQHLESVIFTFGMLHSMGTVHIVAAQVHQLCPILL